MTITGTNLVVDTTSNACLVSEDTYFEKVPLLLPMFLSLTAMISFNSFVSHGTKFYQSEILILTLTLTAVTST